MDNACEFVLLEQGVVIPSRIFVGRIPFDMEEDELVQFFKSYGEIVDGKIICDRQGVSRGFGFITFTNEKDAKNVVSKGKLRYKSVFLNVSKAIRRQGGQFNKANQEYINGQRQVSLLHHHSGEYLLNFDHGLWFAEPLNYHHQPTKPCFSAAPPQPLYCNPPQAIVQPQNIIPSYSPTTLLVSEFNQPHPQITASPQIVYYL